MEIRREDKVWVLEKTRHLQEADNVRLLETAPLIRPVQPGKTPTRTRPQATRSRSPLPRVLLAYLLGPFAAGRWHRFWTPASAFGLIALGGLLAFGLLDIEPLAGGRPMPRILHVAAALGFLTALGGWSFALWRTGESLPGRRSDLPTPLRRPGVTAFIGLWLPGFALLLANFPRRAALALGNFGILVAALLFLRGSASVEATRVWIGYEYLLAGAVGVVLLTGLLGCAFALEGLRLQLAKTRGIGGVRGDRLALLLLAAMAAFLLSFQPTTLSETLHGRAESLAGKGYRLLPLELEKAALKLDDSRPGSWLRVADHCEALGRHQEAARYRGALWLRWREYRDCDSSSTPDVRPADHSLETSGVSTQPTL